MKTSNNRLSVFQECPRKYKYLYLDNRERMPPDRNMEVGLAVHRGLEKWNGFNSMQESIDACAAKDPIVTACARGMVRAYARKNYDDAINVLAVEKEFTVELGGVTVEGRIDAVWQQANGEVWAIEHKTTSLDLDTFLDNKRIDRQTTIYVAACRKMGYPVSGILVDAIRRPRLPTRLGEPEEIERMVELKTECMRELFAKTDRDIKNCIADIQDVTKMIEYGLFPKNPGACFNFNRRCQFFGDCAT